MRGILAIAIALTLSLGAAETAQANNHSCNQLRNTVKNNVPLTVRDLPYDLLPCSAISELHLLVTRNTNMARSLLSERVEAVFRRHNLVQ